MTKSFHEKLVELLKTDVRFVDDDDGLIRAAVIDRAWKIDHALVKLLLGKPEIKKTFFDEIEGHWIFNIIAFIEYVSDKNFLADSYTRFRNKIGLNIDGKFLRERGEVSLVWPYKDCVLEGGQTKEGEKRKEIFFNETLAQDEIDRLFDPKVLTNWKRYTVDGERKVTKIKRDENGTIRENLIIKGNNLLALHILNKQFRGKVKLIYIDPPYNTGNDSFGYNDNFNHSSWLTFMKNRLEVAMELLRDDGVIFVQCDDSEQAYLKVLMDEVFGRSQTDCMVWRKSGVGRDGKMKNTTTFRKDHEYLILAYKNQKTLNKSLEKPNWENSYPNPDNDPRGNYKAGSISRKEESSNPNHKNYYTITSPSGKSFTRQFDVPKDEFEKLDCDNRIYWGINEDAVPASKIFESEKRKTNTSSMILFSGTSTEGKKEIENLFGDINAFDTPKPEAVLEKIIQIASNQDDIVLDYCMGSGTTAAVAHKMERQYIGIEQLDYVENITIERLKTVIGKKSKKKGKIFEEIECDQGGISKSVNWQGGGDFVYCELMKYNESYMDKIQSAKASKQLVKLWKDIAENSFLNWYVNSEIPEQAVNDFIAIGKTENGLDKQKKLLAELLNKNQLYVNLSEIDDKNFAVKKEDKKLNREFYGDL